MSKSVKPVITVPTSISKEDARKIADNGYVVIRTDSTQAVRLISPDQAEVNAQDALLSALEAVDQASWEVKANFIGKLLHRTKERMEKKV